MEQTPNNLTELVTMLQANVVNKTNEQAFEDLQQLVGDNIKIRYEGVKCTDAPDEPATRKGKFTHLNYLNITRVILTSERRSGNFKRELVRQCNGVVLEYPSWNILSVPSAMFDPTMKTNAVVLSDYTVYDIKDGTTVTLYWYANQITPDESRWCLSSTNGFEMNDIKWMGPTPYYEAFMETAKAYPAFSLDKLNKKCSYTIGFRFQDFHPLRDEKSPKMWLIQATNVDGCKLSINKDNIGIPIQSPANLPKIPPNELFKWMKEKNAAALNRYTLSSKTSAEIHYGFVLRSKTNHSDFILESELLKSVRTLMYNMPKRHHNEALQITAQNRVEYTTLRAYLSYRTSSLFITLFPQFNKYYQKYDTIFKKLSNKIISLLKNNRRDRDVATAGEKVTLDTRINDTALLMVKHIESNNQINVMDAQGANIINDFIRDLKYLDWYFTCLISI